MILRMKTFFYLLGIGLLISCGHRMQPHVDLAEVPTVYTWKGPVKGYRINPEKKKVIQYFASLKSLEFALEYTGSSGRIRISSFCFM